VLDQKNKKEAANKENALKKYQSTFLFAMNSPTYCYTIPY